MFNLGNIKKLKQEITELKQKLIKTEDALKNTKEAPKEFLPALKESEKRIIESRIKNDVDSGLSEIITTLNYEVLNTDNRILVDAAAGDITITLPAITAAFQNKSG